MLYNTHEGVDPHIMMEETNKMSKKLMLLAAAICGLSVAAMAQGNMAPAAPAADMGQKSDVKADKKAEKKAKKAAKKAKKVARKSKKAAKAQVAPAPVAPAPAPAAAPAPAPAPANP